MGKVKMVREREREKRDKNCTRVSEEKKDKIPRLLDKLERTEREALSGYGNGRL